MTDLLKVRNAMKAKKPRFLKQGAHLRSKLHKNWRHPRGGHSKFRMKLRSYRKQPSMGYSSPRAVRGLTREGYQLIVIHNLNELEGVKTPIVIAANIGARKRLVIIQKCEQNKIKILNLKDIAAYKNKVAERMKKKKQVVQERKVKHETKKEAKAEDKKSKHKEAHDHEEEKKKIEAEKRKILEKKE